MVDHAKKEPSTQQRIRNAPEINSWLQSMLSIRCNLRTFLEDHALLYRNTLASAYFLLSKAARLIHSNEQLNKPRIILLFKHILEQMLRREKRNNQNADIPQILSNRHFKRALCVCALEIHLFAINSRELKFTVLLKNLKVSPIDVWKHIGIITLILPNLPIALVTHLKEIEAKIALELAWQTRPENFPLVFSRRVVALSAIRTEKLCNSIGLNEEIQEEVWSCIKFLMSEKPDCLKNQSLNSGIICAVFGVSKLHCEIPLTNIIKKFHEIFHLDSAFYLASHAEEYSTVNTFYNSAFINSMKDYLLSQVKIDWPNAPVFYNAGRLGELKLNVNSNSNQQRTEVGERTRDLWKIGWDSSESAR